MIGLGLLACKWSKDVHIISHQFHIYMYSQFDLIVFPEACETSSPMRTLIAICVWVCVWVCVRCQKGPGPLSRYLSVDALSDWGLHVPADPYRLQGRTGSLARRSHHPISYIIPEWAFLQHCLNSSSLFNSRALIYWRVGATMS